MGVYSPHDVCMHLSNTLGGCAMPLNQPCVGPARRHRRRDVHHGQNCPLVAGYQHDT